MSPVGIYLAPQAKLPEPNVNLIADLIKKTTVVALIGWGFEPHKQIFKSRNQSEERICGVRQSDGWLQAVLGLFF